MDPLAFIQEQEEGDAEGKGGEEPEAYDYGELSDSDEMDMKSRSQLPSNLDQLEQKQELDKHIINEAVDGFI